jgi:hypothetical protein
MLGEKKTVPLWRRRGLDFLSLARALTPRERRIERHTEAERAVIEQKAARRRFEQSKGRIHPPG